MIPLFLSSFWVNFHLPIFTGWESANSCTSTIEDTLCSHGWDNWSGQDGQLFTPASLPNLIYGISMVLLEVMPFAFPFAFYFPFPSFLQRISVKEEGTALALQLLSFFSTREMTIRVHPLLVSRQLTPQTPMCFQCEIKIVHSLFCFTLSTYSFSFPLVSCLEYYKATVCILWFYHAYTYAR